MEGDFVRNHGGMVVRFSFGEVREERKMEDEEDGHKVVK